MNTAVDPESETDRLVRMVDDQNPFDLPFAQTLPRQLAAINERFEEHVEKIKLLQNRAETAKLTKIRGMADVVPGSAEKIASACRL